MNHSDVLMYEKCLQGSLISRSGMVLSLLYFVVQTKMPLSHGQDHLLLAIKQRMGIRWKRTDGPLSSNSP